jgi:hypothetical protein
MRIVRDLYLQQILHWYGSPCADKSTWQQEVWKRRGRRKKQAKELEPHVALLDVAFLDGDGCFLLLRTRSSSGMGD